MELTSVETENDLPKPIMKRKLPDEFDEDENQFTHIEKKPNLSFQQSNKRKLIDENFNEINKRRRMNGSGIPGWIFPKKKNY